MLFASEPSLFSAGNLIPLVSIVGGFITAILIPTFIVGMVQWGKVRTQREWCEFVDRLINQGYTIEEIERLMATFPQKPNSPHTRSRTTL